MTSLLDPGGRPTASAGATLDLAASPGSSAISGLRPTSGSPASPGTAGPPAGSGSVAVSGRWRPRGPSLAEIAPELGRMQRRLLLRNSLSLGALTLLTGCDLAGEGAVDRALRAMSRFNDRVQAALFDPNRLAATFPASAITDPFRFNAYYPEWQIRTADDDWQLEVGGLVGNKAPWTLAGLRQLPQEEQITRHICVEGWSQIGQWSGVPLRIFLEHIGADTRAGYVNFRCFDDYWCGLDMASCLHPQTILTLDFEQKPLTPPWGAPLRLRIPTKLGFKNPKYIQAIEVTNTNPGGYWEKQGYNWYSGT